MLLEGRRWWWGSGLGCGPCSVAEPDGVDKTAGSEADVGNVAERLWVVREAQIDGLRSLVGGGFDCVVERAAVDDVKEPEPSAVSSVSFSRSFALSFSFLDIGLGRGLLFTPGS